MTLQQRKVPQSGNVPRFEGGGDAISSLPTDNGQPTNSELQAVNSIFKNSKKGMSSMYADLKEVLLVGFLFVIFSLPVTESLVTKCVPYAGESEYAMIGIKVCAVMALFWVVTHFYLAKAS